MQIRFSLIFACDIDNSNCYAILHIRRQIAL